MQFGMYHFMLRWLDTPTKLTRVIIPWSKTVLIKIWIATHVTGKHWSNRFSSLLMQLREFQFSALGVFHVMHYINVRYLLTYLLFHGILSSEHFRTKKTISGLSQISGQTDLFNIWKLLTWRFSFLIHSQYLTKYWNSHHVNDTRFPLNLRNDFSTTFPDWLSHKWYVCFMLF